MAEYQLTSAHSHIKGNKPVQVNAPTFGPEEAQVMLAKVTSESDLGIQSARSQDEVIASTTEAPTTSQETFADNAHHVTTSPEAVESAEQSNLEPKTISGGIDLAVSSSVVGNKRKIDESLDHQPNKKVKLPNTLMPTLDTSLEVESTSNTLQLANQSQESTHSVNPSDEIEQEANQENESLHSNIGNTDSGVAIIHDSLSLNGTETTDSPSHEAQPSSTGTNNQKGLEPSENDTASQRSNDFGEITTPRATIDFNSINEDVLFGNCIELDSDGESEAHHEEENHQEQIIEHIQLSDDEKEEDVIPNDNSDKKEVDAKKHVWNTIGDCFAHLPYYAYETSSEGTNNATDEDISDCFDGHDEDAHEARSEATNNAGDEDFGFTNDVGIEDTGSLNDDNHKDEFNAEKDGDVWKNIGDCFAGLENYDVDKEGPQNFRVNDDDPHNTPPPKKPQNLQLQKTPISIQKPTSNSIGHKTRPEPVDETTTTLLERMETKYKLTRHQIATLHFRSHLWVAPDDPKTPWMDITIGIFNRLQTKLNDISNFIPKRSEPPATRNDRIELIRNIRLGEKTEVIAIISSWYGCIQLYYHMKKCLTKKSITSECMSIVEEGWPELLKQDEKIQKMKKLRNYCTKGHILAILCSVYHEESENPDVYQKIPASNLNIGMLLMLHLADTNRIGDPGLWIVKEAKSFVEVLNNATTKVFCKEICLNITKWMSPLLDGYITTYEAEVLLGLLILSTKDIFWPKFDRNIMNRRLFVRDIPFRAKELTLFRVGSCLTGTIMDAALSVNDFPNDIALWEHIHMPLASSVYKIMKDLAREIPKNTAAVVCPIHLDKFWVLVSIQFQNQTYSLHIHNMPNQYLSHTPVIFTVMQKLMELLGHPVCGEKVVEPTNADHSDIVTIIKARKIFGWINTLDETDYDGWRKFLLLQVFENSRTQK